MFGGAYMYGIVGTGGTPVHMYGTGTYCGCIINFGALGDSDSTEPRLLPPARRTSSAEDKVCEEYKDGGRESTRVLLVPRELSGDSSRKL